MIDIRSNTSRALGVIITLSILSIAAVTTIDYPTRVKRLPLIDVRTFGAKGDGATNDYTAIQNALNSCPSSSGTAYVGPCHVFIPRGVYLISQTLKFNQQSIILEGEGPGGGIEASNPDRAIGTTLVACSSSGTPSGCSVFSGTNLLQITMDDVNTFNSVSNKGWMRGSSVKNLDLDIEYNTGLVGLALFGLSNNPALDNVTISGGTATSLLIAPSTGSSSTRNTWDEGLVFNNLYIRSNSRIIQGGCTAVDYTNSPVHITAAAETAFRSGKIVSCRQNNSNVPIVLMDGNVYATTCTGVGTPDAACTGAGTLNSVQTVNGVIFDGVSIGGTNFSAFRIIGTDCTNGSAGSCGFGGTGHYGQSDIILSHIIFEGFNTGLECGLESTGLTRFANGNIILTDSVFRTPVGTNPGVANVDWITGGKIDNPYNASANGVRTTLGANTNNIVAHIGFYILGGIQVPIISSSGYNQINIDTGNATFATLPACYQSVCSPPSTDMPRGTRLFCSDCGGSIGGTTASGGSGRSVISFAGSWFNQ